MSQAPRDAVRGPGPPATAKGRDQDRGGGVSQAHWLHYVTALETSVSVNLWAASAEESTLNQLMAPPQPCAQPDDEFRLRWWGLTRRCRRRAGRAAARLGAALRPALSARRAPIRRPQPPPEEAARQEASRRPALRSLRSGGWLPRGDAGAQGLRRGAGRGCCLRGWLCASAYLCQPRSRASSCPKETVFTHSLQPERRCLQVSAAEVEATVAGSGMPEAWTQAMASRAEATAAAFAAKDGKKCAISAIDWESLPLVHILALALLMNLRGAVRVCRQSARGLARETRVVHLESYVEIYAKHTVGAGQVGAGHGPATEYCPKVVFAWKPFDHAP